ncbi:MAG: DUF885 domain-containing protein [Myxococcota bacterium]
MPRFSRWTNEAAEGIGHIDFGILLVDHWEWTMEQYPVTATQHGDRRYDDRLRDASHQAIQTRHGARLRFLERTQAINPTEFESELERFTFALFRERLQAEVDAEICALDTWSLNAFNNVLREIDQLRTFHHIATPYDARSLVARYRAVPRYLRQRIDQLNRGRREGRLASAKTIENIVALLRGQLAVPFEQWVLLEPLTRDHPTWPYAARTGFVHDLTVAVRDHVIPSVEEYANFLEFELLPSARELVQTEGLTGLPEGEACYASLIRLFTGQNTSAQELHRVGTEEIERIHAEIADLGQDLFGISAPAEVLEHLRSDRSLFFESEEEIEATTRAAVAAATSRATAFFDALPTTPLVVQRIPDYEAPYTAIGYYRAPNPDGTKPGEFFINTFDPSRRPRYATEVLAYHESIPGHHLQVAIAQELQALPAFRRHAELTVFGEGWALYTERLADEMGLYSSALDRMGMLAFDAWRAARLVVDTGLHSFGWTREEAVDYLTQHTALPLATAENEVDRYISWPGHALAYKVGQLAILRLRDEAVRTLGPYFDIRKFHTAVLGGGPVTIPLLERRVHAWIAREQRRNQQTGHAASVWGVRLGRSVQAESKETGF